MVARELNRAEGEARQLHRQLQKAAKSTGNYWDSGLLYTDCSGHPRTGNEEGRGVLGQAYNL